VQDFEKQSDRIGDAVLSPPSEWQKTVLIESIERTVTDKVPQFSRRRTLGPGWAGYLGSQGRRRGGFKNAVAGFEVLTFTLK
jgi:hypothetical protein